MTLHLKLYVAGDAPNSRRARQNVARVEADIAAAVRVEIIDVVERPLVALEDGVMLTPMLVRLAPGPRLEILGALDTLAAADLLRGGADD